VNAAERNAEMKRGAAGIQEGRKMCLIMQKITMIVAFSSAPTRQFMHAPPAMPGAASYCHEPCAGMLGVSRTTAYRMVSDRLIPSVRRTGMSNDGRWFAKCQDAANGSGG